MGYRVHSLSSLPFEDDVDLYILVINGALTEDIYGYLRKNFDRIAQNIGDRAVIAEGFNREGWGEQVIDAYLKDYSTPSGTTFATYRDLYKFLPALLITDYHPKRVYRKEIRDHNALRLFIPLRDAKASYGDLDFFFRSLEDFTQNRSADFIANFETPGFLAQASQHHDVLMLQPNFFGIGININAFLDKVGRRGRITDRK